jgi:GT2 family glycosyltransferase
VKVATVIPVGAGRLANLELCLAWLKQQTRPTDYLIVVDDGHNYLGVDLDVDLATSLLVHIDKHEPGMEQPRNVGVRVARTVWPDITHVWFLDSDIVTRPTALASLEEAVAVDPEPRIVVAPYDWLDIGIRPEPGNDEGIATLIAAERNDPRWEMFEASPPDRVYHADLSAGLACFSGNLLWPVEEFERVGGFWAELHHGRCEDGELGLRAVAMDVPISLPPAARGWHLWHDVDVALTWPATRATCRCSTSATRGSSADGVLVDRDGAAFDVLCAKCQQAVPTILWWQHAKDCGAAPELPVR